MIRAWMIACLLASALQAQSETQKYSDGRVRTKSKARTILYSALVPGMGELYVKNWEYHEWGSGKALLASELTLWGMHIYFARYGGWIRDDARALAATHAGVDWSESKPYRYSSNIGKFTSLNDYNEVQRRVSGPEGNLYEENAANYWNWDTDRNRDRYDRRRIASQSYRRVSQYMLFGIFVNHMIGVIHAAKAHRNFQNEEGIKMGFHFQPTSPSGSRNVWQLGLQKTW